jgi:hypothetical protein
MPKAYDLTVKTGEYETEGGKKGRYENIGVVMQKTDDNGNIGYYAIIKRTFNPAGVPNPDNRDTVVVSMFSPRAEQSTAATHPQGAPASVPAYPEDLNDEAPF